MVRRFRSVVLLSLSLFALSTLHRKNSHTKMGTNSQNLPESYLRSANMTTYSLSEWSQEIGTSDNKIFAEWTVKKVEHMKNFHFSAVTHEYLRATIEKGNSSSEETSYLIVERLDGNDEVTVGWKWARHPELSGWWVQRLWRGYFGDASDNSSLSAIYSVENWRATGYSGSDFLCSLTFENGIPIKDFAEIVVSISQKSPRNSVVGANRFWFAYSVYNALQAAFTCEEKKGAYYGLRGKFAGISFLPHDIVSISINAPFSSI